MCRNIRSLYKSSGDIDLQLIYKQQIYNIIPHLSGSGALMVGWGQQILDILTDKEPKEYPLKNLFITRDFTTK